MAQVHCSHRQQGDWKNTTPLPSPLLWKWRVLHLSSPTAVKILYRVTTATAWCSIKSTEVGAQRCEGINVLSWKEAAPLAPEGAAQERKQGGPVGEVENSATSKCREGLSHSRHSSGSSVDQWGEGRNKGLYVLHSEAGRDTKKYFTLNVTYVSVSFEKYST